MVRDRRVFAFVIDLVSSMFLGNFAILALLFLLELSVRIVADLGIASNTLDAVNVEYFMSVPLLPVLFLSLWSIIWPSLLLSSCSHFFGTSLGKWVFGLKVVDFWGDKPTFSVAFGRELMKFALLSLPFMGVILLILLLDQGGTIYDQMLGTAVVGKPKLTPVQKNFRKYYGNCD